MSETVEEVATRRGCIGPFPCGRGAGGNGDDLPCDCEEIAECDHDWSGLPMDMPGKFCVKCGDER